MCMCTARPSALLFATVLLTAGACQFEADVQPLILATLPPQTFSTYAPSTDSEVADLAVEPMVSTSPQEVAGERAGIAGALLLGTITFVATIMAMALASMKKSGFGRCVLNGILTLANGVGVLSGIFGLMGTCVFDWAIEWGAGTSGQ